MTKLDSQLLANARTINVCLKKKKMDMRMYVQVRVKKDELIYYRFTIRGPERSTTTCVTRINHMIPAVRIFV